MPYIGKAPNQGVRNRFIYQATAGQTSFSGSDANALTLSYSDGAYVDVYQNGTHTFNLDIHADSTEVDLWQEGTGSHYAHSYFYGSADGSEVDLLQKDGANHNAQIRLQGNQPTILNLLQQGSTNQSYSITQNCYTVGGCTVNVTQGN